MSGIDTAVRLNKDLPHEVFVIGSPEVLRDWLYTPMGVEDPSQLPEQALREMCRFAVQLVLEQTRKTDHALKVTDDVTGVEVFYEAGELDADAMAVIQPVIDPTTLDPDYCPVSFSIVEETPDPDDVTMPIGRSVLKCLLSPPDLAS